MKKFLIVMFVFYMLFAAVSTMQAVEAGILGSERLFDVCKTLGSVPAQTAEPEGDPVVNNVPTEEPTGTAEPTEEPIEEPTEEPVETEDPTEESAETEEPTEEPVETEEPTEEPAETEEPTEEPAETEEPTEEPAETEEPTEEPAETEEPTEKAVETEEPTEEPAETEEPTEEPAETEKPTEEPVETAEPTEEPTEVPAEVIPAEGTDVEEDVQIVVRITGAHDTVTDDGGTHSVSGYYAEITCTNLEECPEYTEDDFTFEGEAAAEHTGTGIIYMELNAEQFKNLKEEISVKFEVVEDGFINIIPEETVETEEPVTEETPVPTEEELTADETPEPEQKKDGERAILVIITEEPTVEPTEEPTEEPETEPTEEPTEESEEELTEEPEEELTEEPTEEPEEELTEEPTEEPEETEEKFITSDDNTVTEEPEAEPTEAVEETEEVRSGKAAAEAVILSAADETGEVLLTLSEDTELTVLTVEDEWALVQLADGTIGYVALADITLPEKEAEKKAETLVLSTSVVVRLAADGMSEIIFSAEEGQELPVLGRENGWIEVQLPDGKTGFVHSYDVANDVKPTEEPAAEIFKVVEEKKEPKKVTIFTSRHPHMSRGETITLTSLLEGFDDDEMASVRYQWECDKGNGFEPIEGANDRTYSYAADTDTLSWGWRLTVYYK